MRCPYSQSMSRMNRLGPTNYSCTALERFCSQAVRLSGSASYQTPIHSCIPFFQNHSILVRRMGQALRRASGRIRPSSAASSPPAAKPPPEPKGEPITPSVSGAGAGAPPQDRLGVSDSDKRESANDGHGAVLEDRDPSYDKMLSFMVGRITSKPGGRPEMGEASIKERYDRPLPKVRSSKDDDGGSTQRPLTPGTLSIEHIRQIILLHQGKSDSQQGPMATKEIAEKFQVEATVIEKIVQSISLPQEDTNKKSEE